MKLIDDYQVTLHIASNQ